MRFLQHQASARWQTVWLILLYLVLVGLVARALAWMVCVGYAATQKGPQLIIHQPLLMWGTLVIAALMIVVALAEYVRVSGNGGLHVMRQLGARAIYKSEDAVEIQLAHIVDEMVIAAGSGCPRPLIYVLDGETCINAITAGSMSTHFAIALTSGALQLLNREQMQALVAHEMGHIVEEDTVVNQRLIAMTESLRSLQLMCKALTARDDIMVWIFAIVLWILGGLGAIAGRILQSAVSREREFLADAHAVQFTRNPQSLIAVFSKIAAQNRINPDDAWFTNRQALPMGHAFFDSIYAHDESEGAWFDTHPSLAARVARLRQM
jgi:Zn-dependent protease with chaperone function